MEDIDYYTCYKKLEEIHLPENKIGKVHICGNFIFFGVNSSIDYIDKLTRDRIELDFEYFFDTKTQQVKKLPTRVIREKQKNRVRDKRDLYKLILTNFEEKSLYITLTYSDECYELDKIKYRIKYFFNRLKHKYGKNITYLYMPEANRMRKTSTDDYVIHYHIILKMNDMNNPFIDCKFLHEIWPYGSIKIKRVTDIQGLARYSCNHYSKDSLKFLIKKEQKRKGIKSREKSYVCSRNILRPTIEYWSISYFNSKIQLNKDYIQIRHYSVSFYYPRPSGRDILLNHYREDVYRKKIISM